jgi:hypothetical protein
MEPRRESRFAPERSYLAKELQESFLGEILGLRGIPKHAQTKSVNPPAMEPIQMLKSLGVALLRTPDRFRFGQFAGFDLSRSGHRSRRDTSG